MQPLRMRRDYGVEEGNKMDIEAIAKRVASKMNLDVRDKNGQKVTVNATVFPVLHVTDKRPSGVMVLNKQVWFSIDEARGWAKSQSQTNPEPNRFIVYDERDAVDSIWQAGKKMSMFTVEASAKTAASKTTTMARTLHNKGGLEFKTGEQVIVSWEEDVPFKTVIESLEQPDKRLKIPTKMVSAVLHGYPKAPSVNAMEKWLDDGVAKSILGKRVETDGYDSDGSPSWLLALEYI
jgi:hypothetical protein